MNTLILERRGTAVSAEDCTLHGCNLDNHRYYAEIDCPALGCISLEIASHRVTAPQVPVISERMGTPLAPGDMVFSVSLHKAGEGGMPGRIVGTVYCKPTAEYLLANVNAACGTDFTNLS